MATIQEEAVRGSLWTLFSTFLGVPLGLVTVVAAARLLTVGDFGKYTLYSFLIPLGIGAIDLGLAQSLHWSATTGRASSHDQVLRALGTTVTWNVAKLPVVLIGSLVLLHRNLLAGLLLAVAVSVYLVSDGLALAISANRQYRSMSQGTAIAATVSAIATVLAAAISGSPEWTAAAFWTGRIAAVPYMALVAPADLRGAAIRPGRFRLDRGAWSFGLSSYVSNLLTMWVFGRSELVFLGRSGDADASGRFGLVTTVAQRATLVADALYGAIGIALVAVRGADEARLAQAFGRAIRFATFLAMVMAATMPAVSLLAGPVFGPQYGEVTLPCALLFAFALIKTASQPLFGYIYARQVSRALLLPGIVAAVCDVGLCIVLIPMSAFVGALVANAFSGLVFIATATAAAGLPRSAREELVRALFRLSLVLAIAFASSTVSLGASTPLRVVVGTGIAIAGAGVLNRALQPLLDAREIANVSAAVPRLVRPVFDFAVSILHGHTREAIAP